MRFSDEAVRANCGALMGHFRTLAEQSNLNNTTAANMLGLSRSRYAQLIQQDQFMLQAHNYLNLLWGIERLQEGLADGSLPLSASRGAVQQDYLESISPDE